MFFFLRLNVFTLSNTIKKHSNRTWEKIFDSYYYYKPGAAMKIKKKIVKTTYFCWIRTGNYFSTIRNGCFMFEIIIMNKNTWRPEMVDCSSIFRTKQGHELALPEQSAFVDCSGTISLKIPFQFPRLGLDNGHSHRTDLQPIRAEKHDEEQQSDREM